MALDEDGETLNIHYKFTDQDVDSVIRSHELLDQWLRKCQCGKLDYWFPGMNFPPPSAPCLWTGFIRSGRQQYAE